MSPLNCPYSKNTNQIMPNLYNLQFTDVELDTISAALDDYMAYADDEFASQDAELSIRIYDDEYEGDFDGREYGE